MVESGSGDAALYLAREFPGARIRGVDRSPALIRKASARVGLDPEGRIAFKAGKGTALPYPDGFFDLVVLLECRAAAAEIVRVLQPGGHLIVVVAERGRLAGIRESLLHRRLSRRGIEQVTVAGAGDGNFFVGRLRDEG